MERLIAERITAEAEQQRAPLFRLAVWAARRLGSTEKLHNLDDADREIARLAASGGHQPGAGPELQFPGGGDTTLLRIAMHLADLRRRKTGRLRRWRPVLDWLVGKHGSSKRPPVSANKTALARRTRTLPGESSLDGDVLWDTIRGAAGRVGPSRSGKRN